MCVCVCIIFIHFHSFIPLTAHAAALLQEIELSFSIFCGGFVHLLPKFLQFGVLETKL